MSEALKPLGASLPGMIAALEIRAKEVATLTEQVGASLPQELRNHLLSATYRDDILSVTMDSAAWCPQVRYAAHEILDRLKSGGGPEFVKLKVKVGKAGG